MFRFRLPVLLFTLILFIAGCTKIDTTRLGSGLIPAVDNVNTFDTSLDIISTNFLLDDSIRLAQSQYHMMGAINNDGLFGTTKGDIYFETLPSAFPVSFYTKDSLVGFDSVVLSLSYKGTYGDTMQPVDFRVYGLNEAMHADTIGDYPGFYKFNQTFSAGAQIGARTYSNIFKIKDSVEIKRNDSSKYFATSQVRIPLSKAAFLSVFTSDSTHLQTDTVFRQVFKGFKVQANIAGNPGALLYFSLSDTATKLEFFYRRKNGSGGIDTTTGIFYCGANAGHSNNIVRNRAGSQLQAHLNGPVTGDSLVYIYTTPGTYAKLRIPGLSSVSNRIVHRAEIKMTQILDNPGIDDSKLTPPNNLYLDRFDTASDRVKYQPIPFDLNPASTYTTCFPETEGIDYSYFGGVPVTRTIDGRTAYEYTFNITRYVQGIVTRHIRASDLRLSSSMFAEYFDCYGVQYVPVTGNRVAEGRVRVGGGSHSRFKMQLRIIYSRI